MQKYFFGIQVQVNEDGLYRLNDIHHATGFKKTDSPRYWLATKGTRARLELCCPGLKIAKGYGGSGKGTFMPVAAAIMYACWTSEIFFLNHIRAFESLVDAGSGIKFQEVSDQIRHEMNDPSTNWFNEVQR